MVRVATEGGGGNGARRNGGGLGRGGGTDTSPPPVNPDGIPIPPDEATATEQQIAALKIQVTEMVTKVGLAGAIIVARNAEIRRLRLEVANGAGSAAVQQQLANAIGERDARS